MCRETSKEVVGFTVTYMGPLHCAVPFRLAEGGDTLLGDIPS